MQMLAELQYVLLALIGATLLGVGLGAWFCAIVLGRSEASGSRIEAPDFQPGQWAEVTNSLEWLYGNSITVPVGAVIQLVSRSETSGGPRWSAWFRGAFVSNIPEDMIKPHDWQGSEVNLGVSAPPREPSYPPLPSGVTVENQALGWHWEVRDSLTDQVYESGTEASEIEARKMAFAAYDRTTEDETPIVSRESGDGSREPARIPIEREIVENSHGVWCHESALPADYQKSENEWKTCRIGNFGPYYPLVIKSEIVIPSLHNRTPYEQERVVVPISQPDAQDTSTFSTLEASTPGFRERLRGWLIQKKFKPERIDQLFELLDRPRSQLTASERITVGQMVGKLCLVNAAMGTISGEKPEPVVDLRSASGPQLSTLNPQPAG